MKFEAKIVISMEEAERIKGYLSGSNDPSKCLGEDNTIRETAIFENGVEMDIKCCGVQFEPDGDNSAWTEAVLFDGRYEVACSEVSDKFLGDWELKYKKDTYIVHVLVQPAQPVPVEEAA